MLVTIRKQCIKLLSVHDLSNINLFTYIQLSCIRVKEKSVILTSLCLSIALAEVYLFAFHRKMGEPNSMKLENNLASIPGSETNQLIFPLYCIYLLKF